LERASSDNSLVEMELFGVRLRAPGKIREPSDEVENRLETTVAGSRSLDDETSREEHRRVNRECLARINRFSIVTLIKLVKALPFKVLGATRMLRRTYEIVGSSTDLCFIDIFSR
jgi:hypothetical protein